MPSRGEESKWCLFRGSNKVREAVKLQMRLKNLYAKQICEELDIKPYRMSRYLNEKFPNVNQMQLYRICNRLDIDIKINVEMKAF
jgi:hypothetical protein